MNLDLTLSEIELIRGGLMLLQLIRSEQSEQYQQAEQLLELLDEQTSKWLDYINGRRVVTRKENEKMKVMILGYQPVEYTSKKTGELKTGVSVYYAAENKNTVGLMTQDVWVDKIRDPALYDQVKMLDVKKPLQAEFDFDFEVGSRYPRLIGINV